MKGTCKCLNICIEFIGQNIESVDASLIELAGNDSFFKEEVGVVEGAHVIETQPCLVEGRAAGPWVFQRCINCGLSTHALHRDSTDTTRFIVNRALVTDPAAIAALQSSERYSPVFGIVVNQSMDPLSDAQPVLATGVGRPLHQQLVSWVLQETSTTEERIQRYTEQQYAALEAQRVRAQRDHLALARLLSSASVNGVAELKPKAVPLPAVPVQIARPNKKSPQAANRARSNSKITDSDGMLFPLEGMEDPVTDHNLPSDEELSDTDDSGSHDEGIHIPRGRVGSFHCAKSLPVDVPTFTTFQGGAGDEANQHNPDRRTPQDPQDIAASIKALAKSVHGDTVFGDLPRPRFSSQI